MSNIPMCVTCKAIAVMCRGEIDEGTCNNCWEVERRLCSYIRSANGLRKVMAAVQEELSNKKYLERM